LTNHISDVSLKWKNIQQTYTKHKFPTSLPEFCRNAQDKPLVLGSCLIIH